MNVSRSISGLFGAGKPGWLAGWLRDLALRTSIVLLSTSSSFSAASQPAQCRYDVLAAAAAAALAVVDFVIKSPFSLWLYYCTTIDRAVALRSLGKRSSSSAALRVIWQPTISSDRASLSYSTRSR